jgi:hypothetical protein
VYADPSCANLFHGLLLLPLTWSLRLNILLYINHFVVMLNAEEKCYEGRKEQLDLALLENL